MRTTPDCETIVIGGGVVGLAIARELALSGDEVVVLEQHGLIGLETSSRNSEVIHAGIYYDAGSLKARLCVSGRKALYSFCESHGVAYRRLGKLIVATSEDQLGELGKIREKALVNGVDDLRFLNQREAQALEPELSCHGALLSPSTGIIDSHGFMLALQGDLEASGGQVALNSRVVKLERLDGGGFAVETEADGGYRITCRKLVVAAGLWSSQLMASFAPLPQGYRVPETWFAKGNYFKLRSKAPFARLIYPVPEPGGLGVHLALDLGGQARFGPDVEWVEEIDYRVDPARADKFYGAIRRYWPGLGDGSLIPDYAGIRPKIARKGSPATDFLIHGPREHGIGDLVALYGIESPGLTSSLAIAGDVARRIFS